MTEDRIQQGDPNASPLFAETIQTLVKKTEAKRNIWFLEVRNLAYDCKLVLRHVKNILKSERNNGSRLNTEKGELYFPRKTTSTQYNTIIGQFQKVYPKIKLKSMDELEFFGLAYTRILSQRFAK